jgi:formylmethanofuran dehydrogenase subunit B
LIEETVIEDVACTLCGCVCDDLRITVRNNRILHAQGACELAEPWLLAQNTQTSPTAQLEGRPADWDAAIGRAAQILREAKAPLIYGLSRSSTAGQRAAVRLADRLGAIIDTTASRCHAPSIMALQQVGESTCSLGEAKNRCDLVVFWGSNPVKSHPRHLERYSADPQGMFLAQGRRDRRLIVVDTRETETTPLADRFVKVAPGGDFEAIWALRSVVNGLTLECSAGGVSSADLNHLAQELMSCRSGIVYFGLGLTRHGAPHANVEALLRLVTDLNRHTRFYARRMRIPGDVAGADSVLCWTTGFPFSVNLARGYPRYNPGEYSANEVLERGEADACLLVGSEGVPALSEAAQAMLRRIPTIILDYPTESCSFTPTVSFATAVYGVHQTGTAYRMDETPIPLRVVLTCELPSDADVMSALECQLAPVKPAL